MPNEITDAAARSAKATKTLDTMRARIVKADETRTEAAHHARATMVVQAATEAATTNREAAEAWDALATHAATHAGECRHGAELAERTRRRWARYTAPGATTPRGRVLGKAPAPGRTPRRGEPRAFGEPVHVRQTESMPPQCHRRDPGYTAAVGRVTACLRRGSGGRPGA